MGTPASGGPAARAHRRLLTGMGSLLALLPLLPAVAACGTPSSSAAAARVGAEAGPRAPAEPLYVFPGNPLFAASAMLRARGRTADSAALWSIADTASGIWAAGQPGEMDEVRQVTRSAAQQHAIPVIVAYDLPGRDACGHLSSGNDMSAAGYVSWINQLAAAIGRGSVIVVVEPDGVADILRHCLSPAQAAQRYQLLTYAMRKLGALRNARVYLDAGNPGMFANPRLIARPLERAGILYGRGFSANVANFQWTGLVVSWSQRLERALGHDMKVVIDTSRNGNGPYTGPDAPQWCNPPGRALGATPKLDPGPPGVDAYLWIKDPGASDGQCNGGPAAGQYWPEYALHLYENRRTSGSPR
jgi:endoglucanase